MKKILIVVMSCLLLLSGCNAEPKIRIVGQDEVVVTKIDTRISTADGMLVTETLRAYLSEDELSSVKNMPLHSTTLSPAKYELTYQRITAAAIDIMLPIVTHNGNDELTTYEFPIYFDQKIADATGAVPLPAELCEYVVLPIATNIEPLETAVSFFSIYIPVGVPLPSGRCYFCIRQHDATTTSTTQYESALTVIIDFR